MEYELVQSKRKYYIYIIFELKTLCYGFNIFKLGRTWDVFNRFKQYSKNSVLLLLLRVKDGYHVEYDLLNAFNKYFINVKDCGNEYFYGNVIDMINIVKKYTNQFNQIIEEKDEEIRNNYKNHIIFKFNNEDHMDECLNKIIHNNIEIAKRSLNEINDAKDINLEIEYNVCEYEKKKTIKLFNNVMEWKYCNFIVKKIYFNNTLNNKNKKLIIVIKEKIVKKREENEDESKELNDNIIRESNDDISKEERINKYLKIPDDEIKNYKEIFNNKSLLSKHFNVTSFFCTGENENIIKLANRNDFDIVKCKDIKMKLVFLNKLLSILKLDKKDIGTFVPNGTKIKKKLSEEIKKDYEKMMRVRDNKLKYDTDLELYKVICKMYQQLFGITTITKKGLKIANFNLHSVDNEALEYHNKIYEYRKYANNEINKNNENDKNKKNIMNKNFKLSMDQESANNDKNNENIQNHNKANANNLVKKRKSKKVKINEVLLGLEDNENGENEGENEGEKIIINKKLF